MQPVNRFRKGEVPTVRRLNQLVRAASELAAPSGVTGLDRRSLGGRDVLRAANRPPIFGKLSGASSPYTFTQQIETSAGLWANGPITGTAYEVNGIASLNNKIARLFPDPFGRYRFQWISEGSTPDDPFETGDCFCPGGIGGLPAAIVPPVLYYTATWYAPDGTTVTGTTTGLLAYVDPLLIPDATGVTYCPIGGSDVFGWYGPLQRYVNIIDDEFLGTYHAEFREACNTDDFYIDPDAPIDPVLCCNGLWISCNYLSGVLGEEGHFGIFQSCDVPDLPDFLCSSNGAGTFTVECDPLVFTIETGAVTIVITP